METTTLSVEDTVRKIIQGEIKTIIAYEGAPFIKFQLICTAIEFLGACMDQHNFVDPKQSEDRFNDALRELFPKNYHKYAKKDSTISLFRELRCGMVHKLSPCSSKVRLTERKHVSPGQTVHVVESEGDLYLVLEDFYQDLDKACERLITMHNAGKLPTKKMEQGYIDIHRRAQSGETITTDAPQSPPFSGASIK